MARKRLRQVKADSNVLSIQPGGELRDQTVCLSPGLVTMPSRLPFLDESAPSILRSNCTPRYLMLFFHLISCSPRTILGYLKDLLSVTSKASVFSGAIFRHLLSNERFAHHRLSLILSSRILTSSAAHTTNASSAKPMMLVPAGNSMRRKSSYMTF